MKEIAVNATDQLLNAILIWSLLAALAVAIGTIIWAGLYAAVSIPLFFIGL